MAYSTFKPMAHFAGAISRPFTSRLVTSLLVPSLLITSLLAACATKHPVAQADWDQGARQGKITRDYTLPGNGPLPVCLAQLPPAELAAHHFVQVRYSQARHAHFAVAELPATLAAGIGASVEVWPADCSAGQVGRISQVFSQATL